jgi:peptide/nickel transport system ATP-binding protein/oligopeptide transport system ATP-binding protein
MSATPVIAAEGAVVNFSARRGLFGRGTSRDVHAVEGVDLALFGNETVALVGESGSGKTTLGLAMLGLRPLSAGAIRWRGQPVAQLGGTALRAFRRDAQIVFQDPYASLNPRLTIAETLRRPLRAHAAVPSSGLTGEAHHLLDSVGLRPAALYAGRYPHEFSGGQRQRIAIARALALRPSILVADEPVSALDVSIRAQILRLLQSLRRELRLSMLFLSHDLGVVRHIADRVAVMYRGRIVEMAPVDRLFAQPKHPYTRLLLGAAPSVHRERIPAPAAAADAPAAAPPTGGCRFRARCPLAIDRCANEDPHLVAVAPDHRAACHLAA